MEEFGANFFEAFGLNWRQVNKAKRAKFTPIKSTMSYSEDNPWHKNAQQMFGFQCSVCPEALGSEDIHLDHIGEHFKDFCVAISVAAKSKGWNLVDEFTYLCPNCSSRAL